MLVDDFHWDLPDPFFIRHTALADEVDGYGHINNSVYVQWMDRCVWEHCDAVDLSFQYCRSLGKGYAAVRHEIDYLSATYEGDDIVVANWVTLNDNRLRAERRFQIIRCSDQNTILRAHSFYVCTNLETGKPCRIPVEFKTGFKVLKSVTKALSAIESAQQNSSQHLIS